MEHEKEHLKPFFPVLDCQEAGHSYVVRGIYETEFRGYPSSQSHVWGVDYLQVDQDPDAFERVESFMTQAEATQWYKNHRKCTNPKYPQCDHIYTHACDWEQVESLLLRPLEQYRARYPLRQEPSHTEASTLGGGTHEFQKLETQIQERLQLPFHQVLCEESTLNTLRYLFVHMRCGIFVMIRRNRLTMFVPFVNKDYVNTWGKQFTLEKPLNQYYREKRRFIKEDVIPDKTLWWANGNIICNVQSHRFWGDSYLTQLRDMLQTLCMNRKLPDCEFFINKRDFPQLKGNLTEPYDFLYNRDDVPLAREKYKTYAPIASFFVSKGTEFADFPLVCTDDWETATGQVYPPSGVDIRSKAKRDQSEIAWYRKQSTAVFRGNSTGPGTTPDTNQRLLLAKISHKWRTDSELQKKYGPGNMIDGAPFLDAGVVSFNMRDRKIQGQPMTYIKKDELEIPTVEKIPMYEQMKYKYQIYVEGHCAAMRYASMMALGSVILKVDSYTKADTMWYFPLLRKYDIYMKSPDLKGDHIPVKSDFSNLAEVIRWCKEHDKECERIADNAKSLYNRLITVDGQLNYMQRMIEGFASKTWTHKQLSKDSGTVPNDSYLATTMRKISRGDWFDAGNLDYSKVNLDKFREPPRMSDQDKEGSSASAAPAIRSEHGYTDKGTNEGKRQRVERLQGSAAEAKKMKKKTTESLKERIQKGKVNMDKYKPK